MKVKRVLFLIVSIIIITEIGLRIFYEDKLRNPKPPLYYIPDSLLGYKYIPDTVCEIIGPGINNTFKINSHGFIGSDFNKIKNKGVFRICIIGTSVANSMWTNGKKDYSMYLQELFNNDTLNKVEVINCAIDGDNRSFYGLNLIKYAMGNFDPDLILYDGVLSVKFRFETRDNYRGHHIRYSPYSEKTKSIAMEKVDIAYKYRHLKKIYDLSYIVRFAFRKIHYPGGLTNRFQWDLRNVLQKKGVTHNYLTYCFTMDSYTGLLKEINDSLDITGKKIIMLDYGNVSFLHYYAQKNNFNTISLGLDLKQLAMKNDGHPSQKGHSIIAQRIYSELLKNGFIPEPYISSNQK